MVDGDIDDGFKRAPEEDEDQDDMTRTQRYKASCMTFVGKFLLIIITCGLIALLVLQLIAMAHTDGIVAVDVSALN